jgi:hypothetical protein
MKNQEIPASISVIPSILAQPLLKLLLHSF